MVRIIRDSFGRVLDYVRISITDRCNFRCLYCMPDHGIEWIPHEEIMTYEDIFLLCSVLADLGVKRIRFTGGEPFVRRGFVHFLQEIRNSFPAIGIAVTTNGAFLERYAEELSALGLNSVNVSLDTLIPEKFAEITRTGYLALVLRGIDALVAAGNIPVKINTVVMRGFNLDEVPELVRYAAAKKVLLRFIEFMPLDHDVWSKQQYVSAPEILSLFPDAFAWIPSQQLEDHATFPGDASPTNGGDEIPSGPAKYFYNRKTGHEVGIISAVSEHFCHRCNRLRITSTGEVRPCLFTNGGVSIIEVLRRRDADSVRTGILSAVAQKPHEGGTGIPEEEMNEKERNIEKDKGNLLACRRFAETASSMSAEGIREKSSSACSCGRNTTGFHEERHMSRIGG